MDEFQINQSYKPMSLESSFENFLRTVVFQDNVVTPFKSYLSRHLLDGNRTFDNSKDMQQQALDRHLYEEITKIKLIRPERGATDVSTLNEGIVRKRSSLTRVIKDLIRGSQTASKIDYHSAQRFASPFIIGKWCLYAHMECVPFRMLNHGQVVDPRIKHSIKDANKPYEIDSRFVLTIGWPDYNDVAYLNKILGKSPYSEDMIVNGRISWKDFMQCELFSDILQELRFEVTSEKSA
jgi:hypothetical protein